MFTRRKLLGAISALVVSIAVPIKAMAAGWEKHVARIPLPKAGERTVFIPIVGQDIQGGLIGHLATYLKRFTQDQKTGDYEYVIRFHDTLDESFGLEDEKLDLKYRCLGGEMNFYTVFLLAFDHMESAMSRAPAGVRDITVTDRFQSRISAVSVITRPLDKKFTAIKGIYQVFRFSK